MKNAGLRVSTTQNHRRNFGRLVRELQQRPLKLLPERSVASLQQFFAGYGEFGPPIWQDLTAFEDWLRNRLFYPRDTGARWWRYIQLNSRDTFHSFELFFALYSQYSRKVTIDTQPSVQESIRNRATFDFYAHLYAIGRRPGLHLSIIV
jgi:hypothetical protein